MVLWRVHVELADRPGALGELATAVGGAGCNIISLHVVGEPADDGSVTDELLVEVPGGISPATLVEHIEAATIPCTLLVRADAGELSDPVTTALALARLVAADPGSAPRAVATMLRARLVDPTAQPPAYGHSVRVGGRQLHLGRAWPFTATELSRASALMELATQLSMGGAAAPPIPVPLGRVLLGDGSEIQIRAATRSDGPLVAALHAKCSPESRRARFLTPTPRLDERALRKLVGDPALGSTALLALTVDGGSAVGMCNLEPDGTGSGELAILVEDSWQSRGVGTALIRRTVEQAVEAGWDELVAKAHTGNMLISRLLRRSGLRPRGQIVDGLLQIRVELPVPVPASPG